MNRNKIIPQMFDVRPVDETGDLDWKKIESVGNNIYAEREEAARIRRLQEIEERRIMLENEKKRLEDLHRAEAERKHAFQIAQKAKEQREREEFIRQEAFRKQEELKRIAEYAQRQQAERDEMARIERENLEREKQIWLKENLNEENGKKKKIKIYVPKRSYANYSWKNLFSSFNFAFQLNLNRGMVGFFAVAVGALFTLGSVAYVSKGVGLQGKVLGVSQDGLENISIAINEMSHQNFENSSQQFSKAVANFSEGSEELENMGGSILDATRFIPFASKVSSGKNAVEAGKHFALAGQSANEVVKSMAELKKQIGTDEKSTSLLEVLKIFEKNSGNAKIELDAAQENIDKIKIDDLPKDKQDKFLLIKQNLPEIRSTLDLFLNNSHIFVDLLGGNGPRKYLFLFQNNAEMRPTGGFIGSYGLLDIANGHVKKFFIDGIFNPDGQLKDKIVPPTPIQKISATWSLHDSNWFFDFPMSAEKAIMFYEKTGGPTADGVITLTPTIMQKLLEITGPIEMPEYDVTLDANNFVEVTQFEVEVDYNKEENRPKKILSDLAPILFDKLLNNGDIKNIAKVAGVLMEGLNEKHILLYSQNSELQHIISQQKWSGEILPAKKDYLSVVNTNINGFKTDAMIKENIEHKAEIQADGSIIDTVTIIRKHMGGNSQYEWFNKVNADYMRVYVPQGSKLLEVSGQTREVNNSPLDYDNLGFKRDAEVQTEEKNIAIDSASGTRVYNEKDKTVFANWVYVSPQEEVTVTYKYLLPFSLFKVQVDNEQQLDSYSLVAQKQSGSLGSSFISNISYPSNFVVKWNSPDDFKKDMDELKNETILTVDQFEGVLFEKK